MTLLVTFLDNHLKTLISMQINHINSSKLSHYPVTFRLNHIITQEAYSIYFTAQNQKEAT